MSKKKTTKKKSTRSDVRADDIGVDQRKVLMALMKPVEMEVSKLKINSRNTRDHSQRNIDDIKHALEHFGQHSTLLVRKSDNVVINGNGRLIAMQQLGWKKAVCVVLDENEVASQLRAIADNRVGETSTWDYEKLAEIIGELDQHNVNVSEYLSGWEQHEITPIVESLRALQESGEDLSDVDGEDIDYTDQVDVPKSDASSRKPSRVQTKAIHVTPKQYEALERIVRHVRDHTGNSELTMGECIFLTSKSWYRTNKKK